MRRRHYCARRYLKWNGAILAKRRHFFEQTLRAARAQRDEILRKPMLLSSLGWSALQQEHYDEALDWSQPHIEWPRQLMPRILHKRLGKQRVGPTTSSANLRRPRSVHRRSKKRATKLGDNRPGEVAHNRGYVYLDAGEYARAEQSYQQSTELAQQINSKQDIIDALMSLALVSERTGNSSKRATTLTKQSPSPHRRQPSRCALSHAGQGTRCGPHARHAAGGKDLSRD